MGKFHSEISDILEKFEPETATRLRMISHVITTYIPSEKDITKFHSLMISILDVPEQAICDVIDTYNRKGYVWETKGFAYLRAMILGHMKNRGAQMNFEEQRYGTGMIKKEFIDGRYQITKD